MSLIVRPWIAALAVFVISFVVYLMTMDPGLGFIDSGELAAVCSRLGIAHPTGYPLFTLVGWLFTNLPIATTEIARLNVMCAIFTSAAAGVVVLLVQEISDHWWAPKRLKTIVAQKGKQKKVEPVAVVEERVNFGTFTGMVAGLISAFSLTWWQQATSLEVYALHLMLITLSLLFFLKMLRTEEGIGGKHGLYFAIVLGLAFTNHLTSILLAPAMLYAFFARYGVSKLAMRKIGKLAIPFGAMLLVYLYLPLRAEFDPILNWGDPSDRTNFWKHVTGGQYKIWMFTGQNADANWKLFWNGLNEQFSIGVLILALVGVPALLFRRSKNRVNVLAFFALLFFSCLLYAINYDINDIHSYFLLAYLVVAIAAAIGIEWIVRQVVAGGARNQIVALSLIGIAAIAWEASSNYSHADESGNHLVEDYTRNVLNNLPQNAIIFSTQWDFWVSGALYYQLVEGLRRDVLVIDKHLLRDRPWYFAHLKQRAPEVFKRVETELNAFMSELVKFDRGDPFNAQAIGPAYTAFTTALIAQNQDRPIYYTSEMNDEPDPLFAPGLQTSASGIALAVGNDALPTKLPELQWNTKDNTRRGYYHDGLRKLQAVPLAITASRLSTAGNTALAISFADLALKVRPQVKSEYNLSDKERDYALSTDAFFQQVAQMRAQLVQPQKVTTTP